MAHATANRSELHNKAVAILIKRLIVNPMLVREAKTRALLEAINSFWDEMNWFQNKMKIFHYDNIWETQAQDHTPALCWHYRISLRATKV